MHLLTERLLVDSGALSDAVPRREVNILHGTVVSQ